MLKSKSHLFCVCLFFLGCASTSSWQIEENPSNQKEFESSRLTYRLDPSFHGLELELIQLSDEIFLFLNATTQKFAVDGPEILISLHVDNQSHSFLCPLHKGGWRILLSKEASMLIIDSLNNNNQVKLGVGSDEGLLEAPGDFSKHYKRLIALTQLKNQ